MSPFATTAPDSFCTTGWKYKSLTAIALLGLASLSLLGCSSSAGGGGGGGTGQVNVGGVAGNQCYPISQNQGCLLSMGNWSAMTCDPATSKWVVAATCVAPQTCVQTTDPASAMKKLASCQSPSAANPDVVSSDTGANTGNTDAGSTGNKDAGSTGTDIQVVGKDSTGNTGGTVPSCVSSGCASQWEACSVNTQCASQASCYFACAPGNSSCALTCFNGATGTAKTMLTALIQCSDAAGCTGGSTGPTCGNGTCESGETKSNCPADCGSSGSNCGDGVCAANETAASCPADCGSSGGNCGDGVCTSDEETNCAADCGVKPDTTKLNPCVLSGCPGQWNSCVNNAGCLGALDCGLACDPKDSACQQTCVDSSSSAAQSLFTTLNTCLGTACSSTSSGSCGDGTCDPATETEANCKADCCGTTSCASQINACKANTSCVSIAQCYGKCTDQTCADACLAAGTPSGQSVFNSLLTCSQTNCQ